MSQDRVFTALLVTVMTSVKLARELDRFGQIPRELFLGETTLTLYLTEIKTCQRALAASDLLLS